MLGIPIVQYGMRWNPRTKSGTISLVLADRRRVEVPFSSVDEFNAVALILKESPVFWHPDSTISTGWEPAQE